ncbi:MAG: TraB/GumN family protein [Pseudomonadota bacterium]
MNSNTMMASMLALSLLACGGADEGGGTAPQPAADAVSSGEGSAAAEPGVAYWVVSDEDSTLVLFPTIHVLPSDLAWRSEAVDQRIAEADEVWFEVLPSELNDQTAVQGLSMTYGMSPDRPLSERLDNETYARVVAISEGLGLSTELMEPFRPWMAAVTLATMDLVRDGFDPASGVEMVIGAETPDAKERGLETVEQQLAFFGSLSDDVETAFLLSTLDEIEKGQQEIKDFAEAWALGDLSSLEALVIDSIREISEDLYAVLITRRNQNWANMLADELDGSGNDFVAVGAAHLIGEDGVPTLLAERGYRVEGPFTD